MIKSFVNLVKNQRTFCGNSINNLKERFVVLLYNCLFLKICKSCLNLYFSVKRKLGYCLKVSDKSRNEFLSCLIYETYPYFKGDEKDRFRECFNTFSLYEKKQLKFPKFETKLVSLNFSSNDSLEK